MGEKGEAGGGPGAQINFEGHTLWDEKTVAAFGLLRVFQGQGAFVGRLVRVGRAGLFASFCEVTRRKRERALCLWFSIAGKCRL